LNAVKRSVKQPLLWSVGVTILLAAAPAAARPVTYACGEELDVKIDFTPRKAQLHLRDKDYTMQRVKSARDGHYVNSKEQLELIANKSDLKLREGKSELQCRLKVTP
jgi:hypothetical protein